MVERRPKGIDIGRRSDAAILQLLGCLVMRRPFPPGPELCDPKTEHLHRAARGILLAIRRLAIRRLAIRRQKHTPRRQPPMHHPHPMRLGDPFQHRDPNPHRLCHRNGPAPPQPRPQILAFEQRGHLISLPRRGEAKVRHRHDLRSLQPRQRLHLAQKSLAHLGIARLVTGNDLDRDPPIESWVARGPYRALTAVTDRLFEPIRSDEPPTLHRRHDRTRCRRAEDFGRVIRKTHRS